MKQLNKMYLKLQMDRDIDPDKHYISPGGYSCNGKPFDFNKSEGNRVKDHPDQVEFWLNDFDESLGDDDEDVFITPKDINAGFDEFYVYTGEAGEPEIVPLKLLELEFEYYDAKTDKFSSKKASGKTLAQINGLFEENGR